MKKTNLVKPLVLMLSMIGTPYSVYAQVVTTEDGSRINEKAGELTENDRNLKEVTVSSTRSARRTDNIPNVVTITTAEEIQEGGDRNIADVFRDSPDVTVPQQAARFNAAASGQGRGGNSSINIRGLQGNNVMMLVDGIRVPNGVSNGTTIDFGRGSYLEVDGFRKIEVLRGPSSTQFGSDGLAGVVNFQTFNPTDMLKDGKDFGGFVRNGYNSVDSSDATTLSVAGKNDQWSGMLLGNYRVGNEYQNQGSNYAQGTMRTAPNPADYQNWYMLGKAFLNINSTQNVGLTLESQNANTWTNLLTQVGYSTNASQGVNPPNSVTNAWGNDTASRNRVSLEYNFSDYDQDWLQKARTMVYWQKADARQYTTETYAGGASGNGTRSRTNSYNQDVYGINALLESNFNTLIAQRWIYGLDWSSTAYSYNDQGQNGTVSSSAFVPYRLAPDTNQTLGGVFVQNELRYENFDLIPGVRYDWYTTEGKQTSGYTGGLSSQSQSAVSPRIGAVWNIVNEFRPFAQWAMAFQAPLPDQINGGFYNSSQRYATISNPNLKAQTGNGYEFGARGQTGELRYQASLYQNFYQNFISQTSSTGTYNGNSNYTLYQYQNLADVNIWGWDFRSDWKFYPGWQANMAWAWSYGNQTYNGQTAPLNTIQPLRGIFGLRYDQPVYGAAADLVYNQGKQASRVNFNSNTGGFANQYLSPTSFVLNLTAYYKPVKNITLNAYLNNAFNATYWNWSSVQGMVSTVNNSAFQTNAAANIQASTGAPMNGGVSVRYDF